MNKKTFIKKAKELVNLYHIDNMDVMKVVTEYYNTFGDHSMNFVIVYNCSCIKLVTVIADKYKENEFTMFAENLRSNTKDETHKIYDCNTLCRLR